MQKTGILLAILVFAASGCAPDVDVEADQAAIRSLETQLTAAWNAGDLARLLATSTDNVIWMPPNEPTLIGKEAIRAWAQGLHDQLTFEETVTTQEVQVVGDWGFLRATYTTTITPKAGGESQEETGKGIHIMQRQPDGSWKNTHLIWNSDHPVAAAPTT